MLWMLACATPGETEPVFEPVAATVYSEGMWQQRVLTVVAGLDESLQTLAAGDDQGAAELCAAVYRGSFEPELEPLIRDQLGRQEAARTEYGFGLLRQALSVADAPGAKRHRDALVALLHAHGTALDEAQAVLKN